MNFNFLTDIKSKYLLKIIFGNLTRYKLLNLLKYNKLFQEKLKIRINDYNEYVQYYSKIELELNPNFLYRHNKFINIEKQDRPYYHIYFNDDINEREQDYFTQDDNVTKIKIIIDKEVKSFKNLFSWCNCIEKIKFIKFNRVDINNMSNMFNGCLSLKEVNLDKFKTNNVTDMRGMFCGCSLLKELNLNNFITNNVAFMNRMFEGCSSLKELNLNNFNTNNVINMHGMFKGCSFELENQIKNLKIEAFFN